MSATDLVAARLARAIPVDDPAFGQVVRRQLDIDAVARKNLDAVPAQAPGDVGKDRVPVVEFDRERGARKDLADTAVDFQRGLFDIDVVRLGGGARRAVSRSDNDSLY